ncbi:MAG: CocE/NonD family hydrolase [Lentisphaeria bacterium]|nr:CocE/NonD family hydrolase [Lentisphaeria bacterium]
MKHLCCKSIGPRVAAAGILIALGTGAAEQPSHPDRRAYQAVERFVRPCDRNADGRYGAGELARAREEARAQHGPRGARVFDACIRAADTDGDGDVTAEEWAALGERVDVDMTGVACETHFVPMGDGVKLATDVWRPAEGGPFPVILRRTPYGRVAKDVPTQVRLGYAVVIQDMRGRFDSEGENLPFIGCGWAEHRDGAETVAWLRGRPWCNGRIATQGGSAGGITQNLLAGAVPEGLVCQHISVAAASLYHHAAYVGGALRLSQVERWLGGNEFSPEAFRLYRQHPCYDRFWEDFDSLRKHALMNTPAMHVGGWFDTFSLGTVTSFRGRQHQGGDGARGRQVLVMGPWAHGGYRDGGKVGELTFANARPPAAYAADRWFDHHLKGTANGVDRLKPVAYYVMGDAEDPASPGREWRFADDWPPPHAEYTLYLRQNGALDTEAPPPAAADAGITYVFDPARPCPTMGGCNLTLPAGPMDQREIEARDDVAVFTTPPLAEPLECTGIPRAVLFFASDAVDTDLSVRLCDVYPDGRSMLVAEGMLRARFRHGLDREVLLQPGTIQPVTVELWPTSVVVHRGHRIRVAVTSSNHPRFDLNPGTGMPYREDGPVRVQTNTIRLSAQHPSHLVLPRPETAPD